MAKKSEIDSIIAAIQQSRFNDAQHILSKTEDPRGLWSALSVVYIAEVGFQLREISTQLRALRKELLRGPTPSLP